MKGIKVFHNEKRLRDVYPHATPWKMFKWRMRRLFIGLIKLSLVVGMLMAVGVYASKQQDRAEHAETLASTLQAKVVSAMETNEQKIAKVKREVLGELKGCESLHYKEADAPMILDTNNKMSIGLWMFQIDTVKYYYKKLYGKEITRKEAVEIALNEEKAGALATDILFTVENGHREWLNCSNKLGLKAKIDIIKRLEQ